MNKYLFSVLIPNLGISNLLFECLDSVTSQITNNLFDYEIIVCDQSDTNINKQIKSTIENKYAFKKIKLLHSDVKSLYLARHTLIKEAVGEYIVFIDSDDFIDDNYLLDLYEIINNKDKPDIIFTNFTKTSFDGKTNVEIKNLQNIDINRAIDYVRFNASLNNVCFKIFKLSLYKKEDYGAYLTSSLKCGEDKLFSFFIVRNSKYNFFADNIYHYHYRNTPNSMVKNPSENDFYFCMSFCINSSEGITLDVFQKELAIHYLLNNLKDFYKEKEANHFKSFKKRAILINGMLKTFGINKRYNLSLKFSLFYYFVHFKFYFLAFLFAKTNYFINQLVRRKNG